MKARVPVDVDLEDRLIYGLTPLRLGYVALAGLAALAAYRSAGPLALRLPVCVLLLLIAAAAGWAKYDGRHADRWVIDAAGYLATNYRLKFHAPVISISRLRVAARPRLPVPAKPLLPSGTSSTIPEPALEPPPPPAPSTALSTERMQRMRGS